MKKSKQINRLEFGLEAGQRGRSPQVTLPIVTFEWYGPTLVRMRCYRAWSINVNQPEARAQRASRTAFPRWSGNERCRVGKRLKDR